MPVPPKTPPSSDIEGANRDARVGSASSETKPDPGSMLDDAKVDSAARPSETENGPGLDRPGEK